MTRVCVFGAGAVGSLMASHLMRAGDAEVSLVARGEHLRAIQAHGLKRVSAEGEFVDRPVAATDQPGTLPPQDIVFVTLKAMAQSPCAADIANLLAPGGHAVFANNGIPWWWKHGLADAGPLPLLDPGGALWHRLGPQRSVGCVVQSANEITSPGVVLHRGNNGWLLSEPAGGASARVDATVDLMRRAGLNAEASKDIRRDVWAKLLRNVTSNPLCALTRLSIDRIADDPGLMDVASRAIDELVQIAKAHGSDIADHAQPTRESLRNGGGRAGTQVKGMKPSMLQDVLAGRPMEVEAILGQVQLLARETGTPSPVIDALLPLLRGLDRAIALT